MKNIYINKGYIGDVKITLASFPLISINTHLGITTAIVDASPILGVEYKSAVVTLDSYSILE